MKDASLTSRFYTQIDLSKLKSVLRKKKFWSDRDENPHTASEIRFFHLGNSMLVDDDDELQEAYKLMENEYYQK